MVQSSLHFEWKTAIFTSSISKCPGGGIGRRARLRGVWPNGRDGSTPFQGTLKPCEFQACKVFLFMAYLTGEESSLTSFWVVWWMLWKKEAGSRVCAPKAFAVWWLDPAWLYRITMIMAAFEGEQDFILIKTRSIQPDERERQFAYLSYLDIFDSHDQ